MLGLSLTFAAHIMEILDENRKGGVCGLDDPQRKPSVEVPPTLKADWTVKDSAPSF
jgi:hypothetical protein